MPHPHFAYLLDTYASELAKTASVWSGFTDSDLPYRPHERSSSVEQILQHQLLSERRFFAEFLGLDESRPQDILPQPFTVAAAIARLEAHSRARLPQLDAQSEDWWYASVRFFDVERARIWIFWRRVLHTAHHRTQLTSYLRLLDRSVPSTYGPTADVTWAGADPTLSVEAAGRGDKV